MATVNIQVQCPVLWPEKWSSVTFSLYSLEEEDWGPDEEVGKYCGDGLLGYGDDE